MNKSITVVLILAASLAMAAEYAPKAFRYFAVTKSLKYSVKGKPVVTINPSKATSVYLNGTGSDWVIGAGAERDIYVFKNISTLTFTNSSTSTSDPNKIRIMEH